MVLMVANRAQISSARMPLPPCPKQNTCRARCSRVAAASTAAVSSTERVPFTAAAKAAAACSNSVSVLVPGSSVWAVK